MKPTFQYIKTWFVFSRAERNGMIFLMLILIVIIVAVRIVPKLEPETDSADFISLQRQVDSLFINDDTIPVKKKDEYSVPLRGKPKDDLRIELNGSDSAELTRLPGIGPVFASRIIKYRRLLGGYYKAEQLREVYGLKEENYTKAVPHVYINTALIHLIAVDSSEFRDLMRHPYIGKEGAWKIINLRKKTAGVISEEVLQNSGMFDSVQWYRIKPYLKFQKNRLATN